MPQGYYAQIIEALKAAGCAYKRQGKGDHEIWYSPRTGKTFPVDRGTRSRHTANAVMKQAGIDKKF
jgi:hypothetical protein